MRLTLIVYGSLDTVSGGYLYDRMLVDYLRAHGDAVRLLSLPWRDYARHLGDNADVDKLIAEIGETDLLLEDELNHPSLIALNRRMRGHVPIVSIVHHLRASERHPAALTRAYTLVERAYLRTCDAFVFNSATTRDAVAGLLGETRPHVVAHPAGNRFAATPPRVRTQNAAPELLFVGNVIERKGVHTLIDALSNTPWRLRIAGRDDVEPDYAFMLRRRIAALGLDSRVKWLGWLDDAALASAFADADAFAMPSQYEGFGIVYLEAMAFGLPVIASAAGAAREIVTHSVDGFLAPPDDADAVRDVLYQLADAAVRERMSRAARVRFEQHPTWDDTCGRIHDFLFGMTV